MNLKYRTLSNFAELVETGECKNFKGRLKVGVDETDYLKFYLFQVV